MTSAGFKKIVFSLLFCLFSLAGQAQFLKASVGINGLTCSQCSRSVEIQLRKLSFVRDVKMDLEQTEGTIFFRDHRKVDMQAIAKAVRDAGFSLRFLKADVNGNTIQLSGQGCFEMDGDAYTFAGNRPAPKDRYTLLFIGKGFLPAGEMKRYTVPGATNCKGKARYTVVSE